LDLLSSRELFSDLQAGYQFGYRHNLDVRWVNTVFHMHPHYEFYLFIRGNAQMLIEDESFDVHPMDLFIFPPGLMHRAQITDSSIPYERAYFYATRQVLSEMSSCGFPILSLLEESGNGKIYSVHAGKEDGLEFIRQIDACMDADSDTDPLARAMNWCRIQALSLMTCRILRRRETLFPRPATRMDEIIRYINDHLIDALTLEELSDQFFLSKYTLLHEFKNHTSISVHQYILYKRISYAQQLIQNGISPGNAARQSGFNDYAGFYRAFLRRNNITPQAYFRQVRETGGSFPPL